MIRRYKNTRQALFHAAAGRLRGDSGCAIGVIGGSRGPTALFVARNPRRQGIFSLCLRRSSLARAAAKSFAFAAVVGLLSALLYAKIGRKS